jgi:hypothetical protein
MKTLLRLSFLVTLFITCIEKTNAQCTVSDIVIQNVRVIGSTPTSCTAKFDVTFNIQDNNGNKFIFIHVWLQDNYPDYFECVNGQTTRNGSIPAPEAADLGNSFNIGLNNDGPGIVALTTYPPDASVPMALIDSVNKIILPDGSANITLYGVLVTAPVVCGTPVVVVADVWSSQANNAQRAHCVNCGIKYSAGFINVIGSVNCTTLTYTGLVTNNTGLVLNGYYRVFADINSDGYFTPFTDTLIQSNTTYTIAAFGSVNISGPVPIANFNQDVFVVFTQTTGAATDASRVILFPTTECGSLPLPVTLSSFIATRVNRTNVLLKWETVSEINNKGFYLQRNMNNILWESVGFIPSQAMHGNSNSLLTYSFNDINSNKGISQYRIKQVDIDGKSKFSQIRAVRGDAQKAKIIVYPNPSANGNVNIVFEDKEGSRDITLINMNGYTVKQWKGYTNNTLLIDKLGKGSYLLRVLMQKTGIESVEKVVIF